jgi:hypothetical protein
MRRSLTEDEQTKVASIIVEEIASQNWRVERGPPATGASQLMRGGDNNARPIRTESTHTTYIEY